MAERSKAEELLEPLTDDLIQQCLAVGPWEHNGKPVWHRLLDWAVGEGENSCHVSLMSCVNNDGL